MSLPVSHPYVCLLTQFNASLSGIRDHPSAEVRLGVRCFYTKSFFGVHFDLISTYFIIINYSITLCVQCLINSR